MVFQCINIPQVPWEVLKTAAFGLGFQHLPRDLANVNAWKTMIDPYIGFSSLYMFFIFQHLLSEAIVILNYNSGPLETEVLRANCTFLIQKLTFQRQDWAVWRCSFPCHLL